MTANDGAQAALTVDLDALKANWRLLAARAAPAQCAAVVKADAYGIGIAKAVPALARAGCRTFFVAHLTEGIRARQALREAFHATASALPQGDGWSDPADSRIFLLHGLPPGAPAHPDMFSHQLGPVLGSTHEVEQWIGATAGRSDRPPSAIQVDTGMNRIGLPPSCLDDLPDDVADKAGVVLLMSHFVAAEEVGHPANAAQITAFAALRARWPALPASLANSSGIFLPDAPHYDLVRPGYALYGGNPCPGSPNPMRPVVRLRAALLQTRTIETGETVGYNGRWRATRPTRLATIGVGYADGVPRGADTLGSGHGPQACVGGVLCPFVGRISMDLSVIDVTDAPPETAAGAYAELIGAHADVDDLGRACGTIGYEILTSLGRRYHRRYLESSN